MDDLLKASALELATKIKSKETSPTEVLETHIAQIEKVNPQINALVQDDFSRARKRAAQQTSEVLKSSKELPVFFGVPFSVKEMLSYEGMKWTAGSIHHKEDISTWDATSIARLRKAGATPLGTTNVPELGFWYETENLVYGRTSNPYDTDKTSGGSSGGEAALIAAAGSPFGLGSDIGGSVRIPAAYCGIFGHKPSRFLTPLTGHFPYSPDDLKNFSANHYPYTSNGILARRAEDLLPLLKVLAGPDQIDPFTQKSPLFESGKNSWLGRKVYLCAKPRMHLVQGVSDEQAQVVNNVGRLLEELGADVRELDSKFFNRSAEIWLGALRASNKESLRSKLQGPTELNLGKEFLNLLRGKPQYGLTNLVISLGEKYVRAKDDSVEILQALAEMKKSLDDLLGEDGLLLTPPIPTVAPVHRGTWFHPFDFVMSGVFTMLGFPATVAPMGLNSKGLPLSVHITAPYMKDALSIQLAEFLETTFGGWQTQPPRLANI